MELTVSKIEDLSPSQLADYINQLIDKDFSTLVQLLYRLDVSEEKIRTTLIDHPTGTAGEMLTLLIIERIAQREKAKQEFKKNADDIPDDEKW